MAQNYVHFELRQIKTITGKMENKFIHFIYESQARIVCFYGCLLLQKKPLARAFSDFISKIKIIISFSKY